MDDHLRDLERRCASGDPEAAELLVCYRLRSGQKRMAHNWIDHTDMAEEEYDIEIYETVDDTWGLRVEDSYDDETFPTERTAAAYARKLLHVCPLCLAQLRYSNDDSSQPIQVCCHCIRDEYKEFEDCNWCNKVLCASDACIVCQRIDGFKEKGYPDLYDGRRITWLGGPGPRQQYCGTCATDLTRSGDTEIYHVVYPSVLFRCNSCGQRFFPDPKNDNLE